MVNSNFGLSVVIIMVYLIIIITFHSLPICNALLVYFVPILLLPRDLAFTNILPLQSKGFVGPSNPTIQVPKVILESKVLESATINFPSGTEIHVSKSTPPALRDNFDC
jgi:hypothetical protein